MNTLQDLDIGYIVEVELKYPDKIKYKPKSFPVWPVNKISPKERFTKHMKKIKPHNYTQHKKLTSDWTDKKNFLIQYRMLNFYVRHGMIFDKVPR